MIHMVPQLNKCCHLPRVYDVSLPLNPPSPFPAPITWRVKGGGGWIPCPNDLAADGVGGVGSFGADDK
jgi:hypothetical protein